jgi:hypothetical protein
MDTFYLIVASVAVLILILLLTSFGIMMKRAKRATSYPENPPHCPDYWDVRPVLNDNSSVSHYCKVPSTITDLTSLKTYYNNSMTIPTADIYTISGDTYINFSSDNWAGTTGSCYKYKWAGTNNWTKSDSTNNKITWDGITNLTHSPC